MRMCICRHANNLHILINNVNTSFFSSHTRQRTLAISEFKDREMKNETHCYTDSSTIVTLLQNQIKIWESLK